MILINKSFEIITPESAEHGEAEESGMLETDTEMTFRELVDAMREHPQCSSSGAPTERDWFTSYPDQDYRTGAEETTSIHFSRNNPARMAKYWSKAARFAAA